MPNNEEHACHTYGRHRIWAHNLHRWIDLPSQTHGQSHRRFRHDARKPPPFLAVEEYGYEMARKLQIAHLELDGELWGPAPDLPIWQVGAWIYKRMPDGRVYKKQVHGIPQPRPKTRRYRREEIVSTVAHISGPVIHLSDREVKLKAVEMVLDVLAHGNSSKPYYTCPKCEGGVKVIERRETETGWTSRSQDFQYPEFCVHCGYDLRGACLVASARKKEWLR